jgi:hypothetical protein
VEVRSVVRTKGRPWYHVSGNCRSEIKNLCHCSRRWGIDKVFSTDARDNNEDNKTRNPNTILVPTEGQENAEVVLDEAGNAHQLRTLSPQKDTYGSIHESDQKQYIERRDLLTKREITEMITIPTLIKICEINVRIARNITHVQLMLAILERACPPSMIFSMLKPKPAATASKPGTMAP